MGKNIFILYGAANTGKTTTFNDLFNQKCQAFLSNLVYFKRNEHTKDFVAVFNSAAGHIGFYTEGDDNERVSNNLDILKNYDCEFVFGTSRTRGGSCDAVEAYAELKHGTKDAIHWIKKGERSNEDNKEKMEELFSHMQKIFEA